MRKVYLRLFFHVKNHANLRLKYKNSEVLWENSLEILALFFPTLCRKCEKWSLFRNKKVYAWWIDQLKLFKIWNIFEVKMLPGFSYSKNMANLPGHFIKHKPLISEECGVSVEAENHPRIGRENSRGHFSKMQSFWKSRSISSSAQWAKILKENFLPPVISWNQIPKAISRNSEYFT